MRSGIRVSGDPYGRDRDDAHPAEANVDLSGPPRRLLRMDIPGGRSVLAKMYDDDSGARASAVQQALAGQAGGETHPLAIPAVLHYDAASRTLVQELVPGDHLSARVATGEVEVMVTAGRAAARLHSLIPPEPHDPSLPELVGILMRPHPRRLAEVRPDVGPRVDAVLSTLAGEVGRGGSFGATVHRDLHPRQMLCDGERIWIVDWDVAGAGDPALDIGNLSVWLETHLEPDVAIRCEERFLAGYADVAGEEPFARIRIYRSLTFLRLACKRMRLGEDTDGRVLPMLTAAEAELGV